MKQTGIPLEYFFAPPQAISGTEIIIEGEEFAHLSHVMRKSRGENIMVVDGKGMAYEATIQDTAGRRAVCSVLSMHPRLHERVREVHLGAAVVKNTANYDFLVEKCTEVGVRSITPLITERTIARHARSERWQKLALAAMKQSGRCVLPLIGALTSFDEFLAGADRNALKLIPHEKTVGEEMGGVLSGAAVDTAVLLCVGPEGGFTAAEIQAAREHGFSPVSLGPARLRTETAAILATAMAAGFPPGF
jgi:16S rRNA (uracil1498-N3)-methyltransferase